MASQPDGSDEINSGDAGVGVEVVGVVALVEPEADGGPVDPEQPAPISASNTSDAPPCLNLPIAEVIVLPGPCQGIAPRWECRPGLPLVLRHR